MVFSSLVFISIFLPVVFILDRVMHGIRAKNAVLLTASIVFYSYGEPVYCLLLNFSALCNFFIALGIAKYAAHKKTLLIVALSGNLGILILFKYVNFLAEIIMAVTGISIPVPSLRMPIGISFFTFQILSYVIDVYRGTCEPQKNYGRLLLYISFFPQLIAGPIVKYCDIEKEINQREQTLEETAKGIRRFIAGLCKKVLIANTMGFAADQLYAANDSEINSLVVIVAAVSYLFQIYFDFSGYSDMAIGMGQIFGFHFKENFQYPYISGSIQEFWRRWHISLSGWFRDYLYIPLGGNRNGKIRTVINRMIVFLCTGIWHGASWNFIIWGIYHGSFLILEQSLPSLKRKKGSVGNLLCRLYTLIVVCYGFMIFRTENLKQCALWTSKLFSGFLNNPAAVSLVVRQLTPVYILTLIAAVIVCTPIKKLLQKQKRYEVFSYGFSMIGLCLCILSLAGGTYNPFIYFRF